jgi:hypothetical protein
VGVAFFFRKYDEETNFDSDVPDGDVGGVCAAEVIGRGRNIVGSFPDGRVSSGFEKQARGLLW